MAADRGPPRWYYNPTPSSLVFGADDLRAASSSPLYSRHAPDENADDAAGELLGVDVWRRVAAFLPLSARLALNGCSSSWRRSGTLGADLRRGFTTSAVEPCAPPPAPSGPSGMWRWLRDAPPEGLAPRVRRLLRRALDALPAPPDVVLVIATAEWKGATHWLVKAVRDAVPSVVAVLPATAKALREPGAGGAVVARGIAIAALRLGRPLELKGPAAVAAAAAAAKALCVHDSTGAHGDGLDLVRLLELDADVPSMEGLLGIAPPGLSHSRSGVVA